VLRKQSSFALGSTGQMVEHSAVAMERNAHMAYLRFAQEFGLTAAARARIAAATSMVRQALESERDEILDLTPEEVEED
jgi:phage terminase small subunit